MFELLDVRLAAAMAPVIDTLRVGGEASRRSCGRRRSAEVAALSVRSSLVQPVNRPQNGRWCHRLVAMGGQATLPDSLYQTRQRASVPYTVACASHMQHTATHSAAMTQH
jgi:hypothetical protein